MNEENELTELDALKKSYRNTVAPPGFAQRILSKTQSLEREKHSAWYSPHWAYASAFVVIVSIAIVVSSQQNDDLLKPRLASNEENQRGQPDTVMSIAENTQPVQISTTQSQGHIQFEPLNENDTHSDIYNAGFSNIAVLDDVSNWLENDTEVSMPDIANIPSITDIDDLFDTT